MNNDLLRDKSINAGDYCNIQEAIAYKFNNKIPGLIYQSVIGQGSRKEKCIRRRRIVG